MLVQLVPGPGQDSLSDLNRSLFPHWAKPTQIYGKYCKTELSVSWDVGLMATNYVTS